MLTTILSRFTAYVRTGRVASLVSILLKAPPEITGVLHSLGFHERERSDSFMVRVFKGAAVDLDLISQSNWSVFRGDRDV